MDTLILSVHDIRHIVGCIGLDKLIDEVIDTLADVCLGHDKTILEIPPRAGLVEDHGLLEWMPIGEHGRHATIKLVGYHPMNPRDYGLPTILSVAMTFDKSTGHLLALTDATFATALRTGAASAVASRVLAMPDSKTLGLIGAGAQAVSQLHALSRGFDFDEVLVFDTNPEISASFASRCERLQLKDVSIRTTRLDEVTGADIICTATSVATNSSPVFDDVGLATHVHVNAVGSDFPGKTELPLSLLQRSLVAVDFLPQAQTEGEAQQLQKHEIGPDLVQLLQGAEQFAGHRIHATVFDSTGFALEDHAVIEVLCNHARALGCGSLCAVETISRDPCDPYGFLEESADRVETADQLSTAP